MDSKHHAPASAPLIIDLAFDREFDEHLDAGKSAASIGLTAVKPSNAGPRSPAAVRLNADGTTVPALDVVLPPPAVDTATGTTATTNGHAASVAAAVSALTPLHSNGHAAANGNGNGAHAAHSSPKGDGASIGPTPKAGTGNTPRRRTAKEVGLGPDEFGRNPEERANICSRLSYHFASPLIALGNERALEPEDLWAISKEDESRLNTASLDNAFKEAKAVKPDADLFRTILSHKRFNIFKVFCVELPARADALIQPIFLAGMISWVQHTSQNEWLGYVWACAMLLSSMFSNVMQALLTEFNTKLFLQIRAGISGLVYEKSLRLSNAGRKETTTGEIVNLMSSDAEKVGMAVSFGVSGCILVPAQISITIWLIYRLLGPSTFAGLAVLFAILPMLTVIILRTMKYYEARSALADSRVKLTSEVLQGIRVVKFYGWEATFAARINAIRAEELRLLRLLNFYNSFYIFFFLMLPVLISLTAFGVFTATGNTMEVGDVFVALSYFNALQLPMIDLPSALATLVQGAVASKRLTTFLGQPEVSHSHHKASATAGVSFDEFPLQISGGEFRWDAGAKEPTLRDINFRAMNGKLTAVIGQVGSGKTSLLGAMLGELTATAGTVRAADRISLVAQTAWIQNMSVQDNITFGLPYNKAHYDAVVKATSLDSDIAILPAGSATEIGEKGINLSGGQKQRVSLSRALYASNDVIMMDDPLSAVDAHVAEHIFSQCIASNGGLAAQKTRVLVTNQLHFLPRCDYIYVLSKGTIAEHGTYAELQSGSNPAFKLLMKTHMEELSKEHETKSLPSEEELNRADMKDAAGASDGKGKGLVKQLSSKKAEPGPNAGAKEIAAAKKKEALQKRGVLIQKEELKSEKVEFASYMAHFKAMGGYAFMSALMLLFILGQLSVTVSSFWLAFWATDQFGKSNDWYITGFAILAVVSGGFLLARGLMMAQASVYASTIHHSNLLASIQRAPASFFDETPVGRVLNRFSSDIDAIDTGIPTELTNTIGVVVMIFGSMLAVAIITPYFAIALVVIAFLFYWIQRYYKGAALQSERISSVTRSPIFQNFSETLSGVTTLRAYGVTSRFLNLNYSLIDANTQAMYTTRLVFRWASVRTGSLNGLISFAAAIFICFRREDIDPGLVGVSLSFVLGIGGFFGFILQIATELENKMSAVERVRAYTVDTPHEAAWEIPGEPALPRDPATNKALEWPSHGRVELHDLVMSYRPGLEPAIKGLSAKFQPNEKIGVAGRTGSGKSSLMLCLFRMYELKSGSIWIDGVDIGRLGLHTLRKRLAIIPQDPVVFSGTVRDNLDPFREYTTDDLNRALADVHLKSYVDEQPKGLDAPVVEYGDNLSVGQCQLLCIARALLRKPKIILMDEATSSIDSVTDALIQRTVAEKFNSATVITIAHRLNTIMDANRILVMSDGRAAEFDAPQKLIAARGLFASMHKSMLEGGNSPSAASPPPTASAK